MKNKIENNKSNKKGLFKIVLLMVIGLLSIGFGMYLFMMITPKNIIHGSMKTTYSKLQAILFTNNITNYF